MNISGLIPARAGMLVLAAAMLFGCGGNGGNDVVDDATADGVQPIDIIGDSGDAAADAGRDADFDAAADSLDDATSDAAQPDVVDDTTGDVSDAAADADDTYHPVGFIIRKPDQESLECSSYGSSYFLGQLDYVCMIDNDALDAELYIQTSPTDCGPFSNPTYTPDNMWLKTGDTITPVSGEYEFGGRHHNDQITFVHAGTQYMIWHSSIGFGWRACTNPDCLVVCDAGVDCVVDTTEGVATDGCLREVGGPPPPLPVICVQVNADGTLPAFEDPWATQNPYADPGVMILPCAGEDSV